MRGYAAGAEGVSGGAAGAGAVSASAYWGVAAAGQYSRTGGAGGTGCGAGGGLYRQAGATMVWGLERSPWSWHFGETNASNPTSYQVWRPEFDAILLDNARRAGVEVREGCAVTSVVFDDGGTAVGVRYRVNDGGGGDGGTVAGVRRRVNSSRTGDGGFGDGGTAAGGRRRVNISGAGDGGFDDGGAAAVVQRRVNSSRAGDGGTAAIVQRRVNSSGAGDGGTAVGGRRRVNSSRAGDGGTAVGVRRLVNSSGAGDGGFSDGGRRRGNDGSSDDGGTVELAARFVVDASGQGGLLARQLGLREWDEFFRNLAVYAYYRGGERLAAPDEGNILIEAQADGWVWHIPLRDGWASVGAVVDAGAGQEGIRRLGAAAYLESQVAGAPYTAGLLASARRASEATVVRDWSYRCRSLYGPGYVLAGDAGCFIDPLFSSGVHLALTSGTLAAAVVASSLSDGTLAGPAGQMYQELYYKEYGHFRELARLFYSSNRTADSYFWAARRLRDDDPALTPRQSFIQAVAGQPARGYERAALARGLAPAAFGDSVAEVEAQRRQRQGEGISPEARLRLAPGARLRRQPVLAEGEFVWGYGLVTEGHPEGLPCSGLVAGLLHGLDGSASVGEVVAGLCRGLDGDRAEQAAEAARQALQILYVDGAVRG